jgi:Ca2+-binding RTX toxin-like protein
VRINLATGAYSWAVADTATGAIREVEDLRLSAYHASWRLRGTDADETVEGVTRGPIWAALGGGDDTMDGTDSNDYFDGGSGTDVVDGRGGTDTCLNAETVKNCP